MMGDPNSIGSRNNNRMSEWRIFLHGRVVKVNSKFRGTDFRKLDQITSMIDPIVYGSLRDSKDLICRKLNIGLTLLVILLFVAVHFLTQVIIPTSVPYHFLLRPLVGIVPQLIGYSYLAHLLYKWADSEMLQLIDSYEGQFRNEYGIQMSHLPATVEFRWLSDDSGISFRRIHGIRGRGYGQHPEESLPSNAPPTVFLVPTVPGDIHVFETYDPSMKIDETTYMLLMSTHHRMLSPPLRLGAIVEVFLVFAGFFYVFHRVTVSFPGKIVFIIWAVMFVIGLMLYFIADRRDLYLSRKVCRRFDEKLQQSVGNAYIVEFHTTPVPGRAGVASRRYQFIRCSSPYVDITNSNNNNNNNTENRDFVVAEVELV